MEMTAREIVLAVFAFAMGASIGSFLNVCIYRLPLGMSVNEPRRSFCPNCKYHFPIWLNLPIISWIMLRGKCANCSKPISIRYLLVELLTGLLFLALWLLGTLLLTRSWGAIGITVLLAPMILFLARSQLLLVAAICSGIVILYPMLRGADLIPIDRVVEWTQDINPTRAHSLQYRVDNEDQLLDRASEKPLFGWGMWGRNHIYSDAGDRLNVTDGYWIGTIGVGG